MEERRSEKNELRPPCGDSPLDKENQWGRCCSTTTKIETNTREPRKLVFVSSGIYLSRQTQALALAALVLPKKALVAGRGPATARRVLRRTVPLAGGSRGRPLSTIH